MARLLELVMSRQGVSREAYRVEPMMRRVSACLRALRVSDVQQAIECISESDVACQKAASALLIGVTGFFRDRAAWDELEEMVIPRLLRWRPTVNAWSVACSDGAELYSLAMLLHERTDRCAGVLLGSDCRETAIEQARRGVYAGMLMTDLPARMRQRYMVERPAGAMEVTPRIRAMARWRLANALTVHSDDRWDLVLCRNLAIYLRPAAARAMWRRIHDVLRPGGILMVGKAERPEGAAFKRIGTCFFQKEQVAA